MILYAILLSVIVETKSERKKEKGHKLWVLKTSLASPKTLFNSPPPAHMHHHKFYRGWMLIRMTSPTVIRQINTH